MENVEETYAELRVLNSLWATYFDRGDMNPDFGRIDDEFKKYMAAIAKIPGAMKKINDSLIRSDYEHPLVTKYLFDNIAEGYWAFPNALNIILPGETMKEQLKFRETHTIEVLEPEAASLKYNPKMDTKYTFIQHFNKLTGYGISFLSGQEILRQPFKYLTKFKAIYLVDQVYLTKIKIFDKSKFESAIDKIIEESIPETYPHFDNIKSIKSELIAKPIGYVKNGQVIGGLKKPIWFFEYLLKRRSKLLNDKEAEYRRSRKKREAGAPEHYINLVHADVTKFDDLKVPLRVVAGVAQAKKIKIKDSSLDFGIIINLDWLLGDWKPALENMISKLKPKARILIAYQPYYMHMIPYRGQWGLHGNAKGKPGIQRYGVGFLEEIVDFLSEFGFQCKTTIRYPPYNITIFGERGYEK